VEYFALVHQEWGNIIAKPSPSQVTLPDGYDEYGYCQEFKSKGTMDGHGGQAQFHALEEDTRDVYTEGMPSTTSLTMM